MCSGWCLLWLHAGKDLRMRIGIKALMKYSSLIWPFSSWDIKRIAEVKNKWTSIFNFFFFRKCFVSVKTPSQVVCIESSFTIVPSFWRRMGLTLKWIGHLLRQLNFKETWLFSSVNLYKPSYRFIKSVKASCTFTLLRNPQIQKQIFRVTVVCMRHYPCLLVCLSIVFESVFVCALG